MKNKTKKDQYAVYGDPISHSKSPYIHQLFAEQTGQNLQYRAQQISIANFEGAVHTFFAQGGKGLNCTVPLKELAWQLADELTPRAMSAKAVNTLKLTSVGRVLGDNTDGVGLVQDLTVNHALTLQNASILIIGAGGAARGILGPLLEQAPQHLVIANRSAEKAMQLAFEFDYPKLTAADFQSLKGKTFDLIINATSASLTGELPDIPAVLLAKQGVCYDLAYANSATAFVNWGIAHQARKSLDGLGMLVQQAALAFYFWRGVYPDTTSVIQRLKADLNAETNDFGADAHLSQNRQTSINPGILPSMPQ